MSVHEEGGSTAGLGVVDTAVGEEPVPHPRIAPSRHNEARFTEVEPPNEISRVAFAEEPVEAGVAAVALETAGDAFTAGVEDPDGIGNWGRPPRSRMVTTKSGRTMAKWTGRPRKRQDGWRTFRGATPPTPTELGADRGPGNGSRISENKERRLIAITRRWRGPKWVRSPPTRGSPPLVHALGFVRRRVD